MLAKHWRLVAKNATGVAMAATDTITVTTRRWKIGADGSRVAESPDAALFATTAGNSLANGAFALGTEQGNAAAGTFWFGADLVFAATVTTATPAGNIELYYQISTDDGATWPDNGLGEHIATLNFTATGTKRTSLGI